MVTKKGEINKIICFHSKTVLLVCILIMFKIFKLAQGHLAKKILQRKYSTGFVVAEGRFLSYWKNQLIKFEEKKIFKDNLNTIL